MLKKLFDATMGLSEIGKLVTIEHEMNELLGMYLHAEEMIKYVFQKKESIYAFTNQSIIIKSPTEDKRDTVKRYPFTHYQVIKVNIYEGDKDLDVEVAFTLSAYQHKRQTGIPGKFDVTLYIDKTYREEALQLFKVLALLEEKQQEQLDMEEQLENMVNILIQHRNNKNSTLKEDFEDTSTWLKQNVYRTQFSNIEHLYTNVLMAAVIHENLKTPMEDAEDEIIIERAKDNEKQGQWF